MKVFNYNKDVVEELNEQKKKQAATTILGVLGFLLVFYLFDPLDSSQESSSNFIIILLWLGICIFFLGAFIYEVSRINQIILNVQKNKATLTDNGLQIVYISDFTKPNTENFVEIPFVNIKNVQLINSNLKVAEYCNLEILTSTNMYKLCIEDSNLARNTISDIMSNNMILNESNDMNARHKWMCSCGKMISSKVCPFCGKNYEEKNITEEGFKIYVENELKKQEKSIAELDYLKLYLDSIYGNMPEETILKSIKKIINEGSDFIEKEYLSIMISVCNKKLKSLKHWRCLGCGRVLSIDFRQCDCGYKQVASAEQKETILEQHICTTEQELKLYIEKVLEEKSRAKELLDLYWQFKKYVYGFYPEKETKIALEKVVKECENNEFEGNSELMISIVKNKIARL